MIGSKAKTTSLNDHIPRKKEHFKKSAKDFLIRPNTKVEKKDTISFENLARTTLAQTQPLTL